MDRENAADLAEFLREAVGDDLRSVSIYDFDSGEYEIVHSREGVMDAYSSRDVENIVQSYETDALAKLGQEQWYDHGEMKCVVRVFDNGIELNMVDDGRGIAIGLDHGAFIGQKTFIGKCMEVAGIMDADT